MAAVKADMKKQGRKDTQGSQVEKAGKNDNVFVFCFSIVLRVEQMMDSQRKLQSNNVTDDNTRKTEQISMLKNHTRHDIRPCVCSDPSKC